MTQLTHLYALTVLEHAEATNLNEVFRQVAALVRSGHFQAEYVQQEDLRKVLEQVPPEELEGALTRFLELARGKLDSIRVEVISAMPLTGEQFYKLQANLIRILRKQLDVRTSVDPSLIGGVRIVVEDTVLDHSVKRYLMDMKEAIYRGVYKVHE